MAEEQALSGLGTRLQSPWGLLAPGPSTPSHHTELLRRGPDPKLHLEIADVGEECVPGLLQHLMLLSLFDKPFLLVTDPPAQGTEDGFGYF